MDWWKNLPPNARTGILVGVPVLVIGVFGWLVWGKLAILGKDPALDSVSFLQRDSRKSLYKTIASTRDKILKEQDVIDERPDIEARLEEIALLQDEILERLPTTREKEKMRRRIQEMANEVTADGTGAVEFISLTIDEPRSSGGGRRGGSSSAVAQEIVYRCTLKSDLNGLIHYVHKVENNPRFMSVQKIDVRTGAVGVDRIEEEMTFDLHAVSIDIVTYVLVDEKSGGAAL